MLSGADNQYGIQESASFFFHLIHSLCGGRLESVPGFTIFHDSPEDHSHLIMSWEIFFQVQIEMMNVNILDLMV